jgi:hypothetical protein
MTETIQFKLHGLKPRQERQRTLEKGGFRGGIG